jgi:hypothetical protein
MVIAFQDAKLKYISVIEICLISKRTEISKQVLNGSDDCV